MSTRQSIKRGIAISISGALVLSVIEPAWAAPVLSNTAAVKSSLPSDIETVRVRNRSGAVAAGVAIGIMGALVASSAARSRTYYYYGPAYPTGPYYYSPYGYGPYSYGPYYGPGYYGPYPYSYGHYHDGRDAAVAGAVIGAMIGAAVASGQNRRGVRRQPYIYVDPQRVW